MIGSWSADSCVSLQKKKEGNEVICYIFSICFEQAQESLGSCEELHSPSNSSLNALLILTIDGTVVMDQVAYSLLEPLIAAQMSYLLPGSYALDASKYLHKICQLMRSLFKPCLIRGYHVFCTQPIKILCGSTSALKFCPSRLHK